MNEWVLILTLIAGQGVTMHSVVMENSESCENAGKMWFNAVDSRFRIITWVCVKR